MTHLHEILRVEPAAPFRLAEIDGRTVALPVGTWRCACRCGHTTRPRKRREHAISDGVRHCAAYDPESAPQETEAAG